MATNTVEKSIEVEVPISTAYNQWTQFESFPKFMDGIDQIKQTDDTHMHWNVSIGGVKREFDAEITEQHPDERIAWRSIDGKEQAGIVSFQKIEDDLTKITLQMDWEAEGAVEKVGAAIGVDDRQVDHDLKKFKELIESNGFEEGAWRDDISNSNEIRHEEVTFS